MHNASLCFFFSLYFLLRRHKKSSIFIILFFSISYIYPQKLQVFHITNLQMVEHTIIVIKKKKKVCGKSVAGHLFLFVKFKIQDEYESVETENKSFPLLLM